MSRQKPFKLWLKEKLVEASGVCGALAILAAAVTFLARNEGWAIYGGLFAVGALASAIGLGYLSTLLKPRKAVIITSTSVNDWSMRR